MRQCKGRERLKVKARQLVICKERKGIGRQGNESPRRRNKSWTRTNGREVRRTMGKQVTARQWREEGRLQTRQQGNAKCAEVRQSKGRDRKNKEMQTRCRPGQAGP